MSYWNPKRMADAIRGRRNHPPKRVRLERLAAEMRAYNLTHGSGCAARRRAIEARLTR